MVLTASERAVRRLRTWVWVLVYGGLILLAVGLSVERLDPPLGWGIAGLGIASIAVGVALIWVRSRMTQLEETR